MPCPPEPALPLSTPVLSAVPDVAVIGAGVIGLMTARELLLSGARVSIFDAGDAGQESSWAGGGIVSPLYPWRYADAVTALANWAQAIYPSLCAELLDSTGVDSEWQPSGLLLLSLPDMTAAADWARRHHKPVFELPPDAIARWQAGQRAGQPALFFPGIAQVRNPRLVKALLADVQRLGATLHLHTPVDALLQEGERVIGVQSGAQRYRTGKVLICAGAWSARLCATLGVSVPIRPMRGQMLLFAPHAHPLRRIVLRDGRYLIPRRDGRILCGSTLEDVGFDKSVTHSAAAELQAFARDLLPSLADVRPERHWAGLRPGSPQGIPLIGAVPGHAGLFINAGHFRNGVVLAPASALLAADLLLGRPPVLDPAPYALVR